MTNTADIGARLDEARLELLRRRLADRGLSSAAQDIGPHTDDRLSDGQARMWFVQMADPSGALLNICVSYRITGDIDLARLRDAVNAVARRHRILRTTYPVGDDGVAQPTVHADLRPGWTQYDLTDLSQRAQRLRSGGVGSARILRSLRAFPRRAIANHGGAHGCRRTRAAVGGPPHRLG